MFKIKCSIGRILIFFVALFFLSSSFSKNSHSLDVNDGYLIVAWGGSLIRIDLKKPDSRDYLYSRNGDQIGNINKIKKGKYLFGNKITKQIFVFEYKQDQFKLIANGYTPKFVPSVNKVLFYDRMPAEDKFGLFVADYKNSLGEINLIFEGDFGPLNPPVDIGEGGILFYSLENGKPIINQYNLNDFSQKKLNINSCVPLFWRKIQNQLFCFDENRFGYFLTDLDGQNRSNININKGMTPTFYIEKFDSIIVYFERGGKREIGILRLDDPSSYRTLVKNLGFGLGGVIWLGVDQN